MEKAKTEAREAAARARRFRERAYPGAGRAEWEDWRWQLRNRARTAAEVGRVLELSAAEKRGLAARESWRMPLGITPYMLMLLSEEEPGGALRRMVLPSVAEGRVGADELLDSLGEEAHEVAPGLVRSYPHKVLLLATTDCACFCRYCTRSRTAGKGLGGGGLRKRLGAAVEWIRGEPDIRDVLVSGGDPLVLPDGELEWLLSKLRAIPHVRLLRIGSKAPATLPQRITSGLVRMLRKFQPLWMSLHFSHPRELTPEAGVACRRLRDAGIPLLNQCVLLRGVNDDAETMRRLNEGLAEWGVHPYYLHLGDMVAGTAHWRASRAVGRQILREMCGKVSGFVIPHFMFDEPGGGGKRHLGF